MARRLYSLVTRGTWTDRRFLQLARPAPNAQTLWLYLLTGDIQGPIPGLFRAGIGTIADGLGGDYAGTAKALAEIEAQGMVERCALPPLLWLPKAIHHNPPQSPNVVRSWGAYFRELPECDLRDRAILAIREGLPGPPFHRAFDTTFADLLKPSRKPSGEPPIEASAGRGPGRPQGVLPGAQVPGSRAVKPSGKPSPNQDPRPGSPEKISEALELANRLKEAIGSHTPRLLAKARPDAWAVDIERMIRLDKVTPGEIRTVISFAHEHPKGSFWRANLLSGRALRKQFDRLLVQAREAGVSAARGTGGNTHGWLAAHAAAVLRWRDIGGDRAPDALVSFLAEEDVPPPPNVPAVLSWLESRP